MQRRVRTRALGIRDELEQAAVRVAEVDAHAATSGAEGVDRAGLDVDAPAFEVCDGILDRTRPDEAEIAVARLNGEPRNEAAHIDAGAVHVELRVAHAVGEPPAADVEDLRTDDVTVKRVGPVPVGDRDHAVVEALDPAHDRTIGHGEMVPRSERGDDRRETRSRLDS